jgi:hypothetical protein
MPKHSEVEIMSKKPEPAELTERVIFPLSPELLGRIEDFRFDNRIGSRAEAMRRLLSAALDASGRKAKAA